MKERYRLYRRANGCYYIEDKVTGKQESLKTKSLAEARQLLATFNQAAAQPLLNKTMAKALLAGSSPELTTRTWNDVMTEVMKFGCESTQERCARAMRSAPFDIIRGMPIIETDSSHFLKVLNHERAGTSTNVWLRRIHSHALDLGWLLTPVLNRRAWKKIEYKPSFPITEEEHRRIIAAEGNEERRNFYEMMWLTGGSPSDIAELSWDRIDRDRGIIWFQRKKRKTHGDGRVSMKIGRSLQALLDKLPQEGFLFPKIRLEKPKHRSAEFRRRRNILKIDETKNLKAYRYALAGRAKNAGMPLRDAMNYLGHKSKAIHLAYADATDADCLPLEFYEEERRKQLAKFQKEHRNGHSKPTPSNRKKKRKKRTK